GPLINCASNKTVECTGCRPGDTNGFTTLWSFGATPTDGQTPHGGVIEGSDGVLYGTTWFGGGSTNEGTVFKINKDGSGYTKLHAFGGNGSLSSGPRAGLLEGSDGWLYGTTRFDPSYAPFLTGAILYKLKKDGSAYTVVHYFSNPD